MPSVVSATARSSFSSRAVATWKPSTSSTVPSGLPIPIGWIRTPATEASSASGRGSSPEVSSPSDRRMTADEP